MHLHLKRLGLTLAAAGLTACADYEIDSKVFYGDLSESEQTKYMSTLVAAMNAETQKSSSSMNVAITGDTVNDIITSSGTYNKVVQPDQLDKARAAITKIKAENPVCLRPDVLNLNRYGIGYKAIMKDPSGKVVYESELCEGAPFAPRPYNEQTEAQQAYSLDKIAEGLDAKSRAMNTHPNSKYKVTFKSDSVKDILYGEHQFNVKLSPKETAEIKAAFDTTASEPKTCTGEEVLKLNENGVRFEYRIIDYQGRYIIAPLTCPAKNAATVSTVPKLRKASG